VLVPETIEGAAYRRHAFLLAFLNKAEVDALFAQNPLRIAQGLTPAAAHQQARTARESLAAYESGTTQPLQQSLVHLADEVRQRAVYKKEYEAKGDYEFVSVPIESLLAPQINVDLDYVDDLSKRLPPEPSDEVDFAFAFPTGEIAEPIVKGNTVVFTSYAPNIAVTPIPILRRTPEGFEVIIEAKSRPNFVLIARVAGRLVLHNGVHKILALKARGRTHAFGVAYDVPQAANLGLLQGGLSMFSDPNFVQATRPPLVIDFNGPAAVQVLVRATVNVYRSITQVEQIVAPAV
jgi:hypothetical protein